MRRNAQQHQQPSANLERLRIEAGLTPAQLAEAADVSPNTVRYAERGQIPGVRLQVQIASALSDALERRITHTDLWPLLDGEAA